MNYASILSHLYGSYRPPIIDLLNQSIYASDYNIEKEDFVVHTGFSFDLQNNTMMELLYHLDTGNLIWQVLLPQAEILPAIAGMLYMKNNSQYFNAAYPYIMTSCDCEDESKNEYQRIRDIDSLSKNWRCRSIDLCDTTEPQTCLKRSLRGAVHSEIPLTRRMYGPVFFDGRRFSEPRSFNYDDDDYDDYRQRYGKYAGSYAQDEAGLSDDFVNDVLDGDPDAFWNID